MTKLVRCTEYTKCKHITCIHAREHDAVKCVWDSEHPERYADCTKPSYCPSGMVERKCKCEEIS